MTKLIGAATGLLVVMGSVLPAGQSISATSPGSPDSSMPSVASWDWPK